MKRGRKGDYRTALITGASSGIGRGLALALGRRGTHVIAAARRQAQLTTLVDEIAAAGGSAEALVLDCAKVDTAYETIRKLDERRPLDLVIANAGWGAQTPAKKLDWGTVKQILELNVVGAAATLCAALPGMVARNQGQLVGIASLAGLRVMPTMAAYSASKAALITFLEGLRLELHATGVDVTTICPGYIKTELTAQNRGPMPFLQELDAATAKILRAIDRRQELYAFPQPLALAARTLPLWPAGMYRRLGGFTRLDKVG